MTAHDPTQDPKILQDQLIYAKQSLANVTEERDSARNLAKTLFEDKLIEEKNKPKLIGKISINAADMFDKREFIPKRLVDEILHQLPKGYLITPYMNNETTYRYDEYSGIYRPDGVGWVESKVSEILDEETKRSRLTEVIKIMQVETYYFGDDFFQRRP